MNRRKGAPNNKSFSEEGLDMTPPGQENSAPRSVMETEFVQKSKKGIGRIWSGYISFLANYYRNMSKEEQDKLISQFSLVITMGVTAIILAMFYSFIPAGLSVFIVPIILGASWWAGSKIVPPIVIARLEDEIKR